jgi:hypothetical protein
MRNRTRSEKAPEAATQADTNGQTRPELGILHETLAGVDWPATALNWLKRPIVRSVLPELATGHRPLTHAALDDLPPGKPIEHLRSVLVYTGALPTRDEHLARIERCVTHTINEHSDPDDKELLHRYAVWHVLRRLRQRNRGTDTTYLACRYSSLPARTRLQLCRLHARMLAQRDRRRWLVGLRKPKALRASSLISRLTRRW